MFRVGFGQDSHRFSKDGSRRLILGGIEIPGKKGLEGNSDADVVIHSICRALEQAIGGDSFSVYADKLHNEGINDSRKYLQISKANVEKAGYAIGNLGISMECKEPRIIPVAEKMKESLGEILGIKKDQIGINATSGESLTAFGQGEGIQVFAIVSLLKK